MQAVKVRYAIAIVCTPCKGLNCNVSRPLCSVIITRPICDKVSVMSNGCIKPAGKRSAMREYRV